MAPLSTLVLLIILRINCAYSQGKNNVCETVNGYFDNMQENPNCWFDSDVNAAPEQIAKNHGLQLERHIIRTEDKYVLTTFRVKSFSGLYGKEVIFLQHGLGSDGQCFMANGNKSVAFFLFEQGYDVWIGNYRGSEFSQHEFLLKSNPEFWNFCIHQHGIYDLAANFKYISDRTKKKITYLGHSMGGTGFGIYASIKTAESKKYIKQAILLAPAFYLRNTRGLANRLNIELFYSLLESINMAISVSVLFGTDSFEKRALERFCFSSLNDARMCISLFDVLFGRGKANAIPPAKFPLGLQEFRNSPLNDVLHFMQMIKYGDFMMYDYGPAENIRIYNSLFPPPYNLSNITIPLTWIYGTYDNLATKSDIIETYNKLRKRNWSIHELPYGHLSFLYDPNADKTAYPLLLKVINKYEK